MAIMVTCSNCGKTLQAKDEWAGKNVKCPGCQQVLTVPGLKAAPKGPPPMPGAVKPAARRPADEDEDQPVARRRRDDDDDAPRRRRPSGGGGGGDLSEIKEFNPLVLLLLSFVCGLVPPIWVALLHGKLPKERDDDPDTTKALIFLLVPFLNIFYGIWLVYRRLPVRLNEQRERYGLDPDVQDPLTWMILLCIPCANIVGAIMLIVWLYQMQTKVNELVQAANG